MRNLASRSAGQVILMDLEHEPRAVDQARFTTDGIHFDSIEGLAWINRVFQVRLDELEVELFDTGVLRREETTTEPALSTFVPPNIETRLGSVAAVPQLPQSSSEPGQRTDGELRPTCQLNSGHDLRHLEIGKDEYEQRGTTSRQKFSVVVETHTFPLHVYKQHLMKSNIQTVKFAADAMRMMNGAKLSVNGLYSILGVNWLIAARINGLTICWP